MRHSTLIVPGFHGSGEAHWQTWLEGQLDDARRVAGIDWEAPVLARWAGAVRAAIDATPGAVWVVAHSFGCLASVVAVADRADRVAGLLLVAPADPERFSPLGVREQGPGGRRESVAPWLPDRPLPCASAVVASSDDPWVKLEVAAQWAERWGSRFIDVGAAGHINVDSGFGPWPFGLELLQRMQRAHQDQPLGSIAGGGVRQRGRQGALARLRHRTRYSLAGVPVRGS